VTPRIYILAAIAALFIIAVAAALWNARRHWKAHNHRHGFWYEVSKDFIGPVTLALVGFYFAISLEEHRVTSAEEQSKGAILREIMTSRNGPDVAFFTALGERLTIHLQRYKKHQGKYETLRKGVEGKGNVEGGLLQSYMDKNALFDERALYFFSGMLHVALADFLATKGFILYPRIWMEQAFEGLTNDVVKHFMGTEERDLSAHPEEEAALYRYFGASRAMYHTGNKRSAESVPDLFEFNLMLEEQLQPNASEGYPYYARHVIELQKGFERFQARLRHGDIKPDEIIPIFEAIVGLDDYAFNTFFSKWYKQLTRFSP
jgi:hypothetical protein